MGVGKVLLRVASVPVSDARGARERVASVVATLASQRGGGELSLTVWEPPEGWAASAASPQASSSAAASSESPTGELPNWGEDDMPNLVRVCRRLEKGSAVANLRKFATALRVCSDGASSALKVRIELKLRELGFESNAGFKPTADDLQLCDAEFDEKFDKQKPYSISAIVRALSELLCYRQP